MKTKTGKVILTFLITIILAAAFIACDPVGGGGGGGGGSSGGSGVTGGGGGGGGTGGGTGGGSGGGGGTGGGGSGTKVTLNIHLPTSSSGSSSDWPHYSDPSILSKLDYNITLSGNGETISLTKNGGGTVQVTVSVGYWTLSVNAFYNGSLYAVGSTSVNVIAGANDVSLLLEKPPATPVTPPTPPVPSNYTVTFNSGGGSSVASQNVSHGDKVSAPLAPTRAFTPTAGLYLGSPPSSYTFVKWQKDGIDWDFAIDTVTENITLTAVWEVPSLIDLSTTAGANDLVKAVTYINANADEYTLLLNANITNSTNLNMNVSGSKLSIIGINPVTITMNATAVNLFTLGSGVELTLGDKITLTGSGGVHDVPLIQGGGTLTMLTGSRVTGYNNGTGGGSPYGATLYCTNFILKGGEVTGNTNNNTDNRGCIVGGTSFIIESGRIAGNISSSGFGDGIYVISGNSVTLSGNAQISRITLDASTGYAQAYISASFTGSVAQFNLRMNNATVISMWEDRQVIAGSGGYTLTPADIANIGLGNFYGGGTNPINTTHYIDNNGYLRAH